MAVIHQQKPRIKNSVRGRVFVPNSMGAVFSSFSKVQWEKQLRQWVVNAWHMGRGFFWVVGTTALILGLPLLFEYERECQAVDIIEQLEEARQHAALMSTP
eukprot:Protomagalhaensia_sp_Gyna_25__6011@NODE_942_length_2374_cov_29_269379_g748_i0_p3_GENE_NODE_942_length_2374_cov_29_269379_g748_i0NODE_942_length_2374_cov_29_269379_g748_i0_p3_ORF_typecomplete_len101_score8_47Tom22/PF04281_13/1_1e09Cytochrom_B_N_2/PF13631_6/0_14_NODE_942_length_2374_cov_29_269379_g748_i094396